MDKQDKLRQLEKELNDFDRANEDCAVSRDPNDETRSAIECRTKLLDRINNELSVYCKLFPFELLSTY